CRKPISLWHERHPVGGNTWLGVFPQKQPNGSQVILDRPRMFPRLRFYLTTLFAFRAASLLRSLPGSSAHLAWSLMKSDLSLNRNSALRLLQMSPGKHSGLAAR